MCTLAEIQSVRIHVRALPTAATASRPCRLSCATRRVSRLCRAPTRRRVCSCRRCRPWRPESGWPRGSACARSARWGRRLTRAPCSGARGKVWGNGREKCTDGCPGGTGGTGRDWGLGGYAKRSKCVFSCVAVMMGGRGISKYHTRH
eukprot:247609-Chlamydomonas_euryale.AAC.1